ncbi:MAG TPA: hypothetical protein EYP10_14225, partial [Armatimonadetes bacterium]|nr:hypothetical protein [Armatimonadota bacterium]
RYANASQRLSELDAEARACDEEWQTAEARVHQLDEEIARYEADLEDQRVQHIEAMRRVANLRNQLIDYQQADATLRARLEDLHREHGEAVAQLHDAERQLANLDSQLQEAHQRQNDIHARMRAERQTAARCEEMCERLRHQVSSMRELLSGLKARLNALEESEASLHGVREGPRNVLLAARNGELRGRYQLVAHVLQVPAEYEMAISIALGGALEYIVTDTTDEAQLAIEHLKRTQGGRATFLTLDFLRPRQRQGILFANQSKSNSQSSDGIIGWANELVGVSANYEKVRDYLLSNVLVVENLDIATALGKQLPSGLRIVTLEGDLVIPGGAISGGRQARAQHSLLARRREIEELRGRIREIEGRIQRAEREL